MRGEDTRGTRGRASSLDEAVGRAVARISAMRKYRSLSPQTVDDVVRRAAARHPKEAPLLRSARETLHRVAAFYLGEPDYARAEEELVAARGDDGKTEEACLRLLRCHDSSRERLPIMESFYRGIFARTGTPGALLDLAAACNPFAFRWMGLPRSVLYRAFDINADMVRLVSRYFELEGIAGAAELRDVLCDPPEGSADVALLLKMYHCLEHRQRGAGWEVVSRTNARFVAVSFPSRNLRGRRADIAGNYRDEILERSRSAGWGTEELAFDGELVILVRKGGA